MNAKITHETGMADPFICSFIQWASDGSLLCLVLSQALGIYLKNKTVAALKGLKVYCHKIHKSRDS